MRPRLLKMTAFGPYAGEQVIDFEQLEEANMFLIYGPTGGGKTTILDAICYALYGETNGGERSGESMRSKFADAEAITEVDLYFKLRQEEYRIIRRPQYERAAKRGTGTVKVASEVELYKKEGDTFTIMTSRYNEVSEKINNLLHFNIGQFRQVIMIAQNKFRELLNVSSKERQQILQDIFETGIYQDVEKSLEVLYSSSKEWVKEKQFVYENMLSNIEPIEVPMLKEYLSTKVLYNAPQVCEILKETCNEKASRQSLLEKDILEVNEALEIYQKKLGEATKQYEEVQEKIKCQEELEILNKEEKDYDLLDQKIISAEKALRLVPLEEVTLDLKKEVSVLKAQIEKSKLVLETLKEKWETAQINFKKIETVPQEVESIKKEYSLLENHMPKVITLNEKLEEKKKLEILLVQEEKNLELLVKQLESLKAQVETMEAQIKVKDDLQKSLAEKLVIQKEMEAVLSRKKARQLKEEEKAVLLVKYRQIEDIIRKREQELVSCNEEYRRAFEAWLQNQAGEIAKRLEEDKPCPVCGAVEHPQKAILTGEQITREQLEKIEKRNKVLELELARYKEERSAITQEGKGLRQIIEDYSKELEGKEGVTVEEKELLDAKIVDLQKQIIHLEKLQGEIETHRTAIRKIEGEKEEITKGINQQKLYLNEMTTYIKTIENDMPKHLQTKEAFMEKLESLKTLYRQKEEDYKKKAEEVERLKSEVSQNNAVLLEKQNHLEELEKQQLQKMEQLEEALRKGGFDNLEHYKMSKMSVADLEIAKGKISSFKQKKALLLDQVKALVEKTKDFSMEKLEAVQAEHKALVAKSSTLAMERQSLVQYRQIHEKIIKDMDALYHEVNEMLKKQRVIEKISLLAKGKNKKGLSFERYIQSSIFEEVLRSANKKLKPMTQNRYELYRTDDLSRANAQAGLDIGIMDYYSNERRPVNTLSGGESFMAALALALGLSEVIQRLAGATPLDTLFIDEGFGSLDEEALELAIKTLLSIQDTGRLIGIISHVRELREQIPVGLEIRTGAGGSTAVFKV